MIPRMLRRLLPAFLLFLSACDRKPTRGVNVPQPTRTIAQITALCQLPPGRPTHVAVDPLGNVFYSNETDRGTDGMMAVGETTLPRATELTSVTILAALGEAVGGNGTIQDLAAGPDGMIYFYFVGGKGRTIRACIGRFDSRKALVTVLADTDQLMMASGMGDSIALARGTLIPQGNRMSLWLRHFDGWVLLHFDPRRLGPGGEELIRSFSKVVGDGIELKLSEKRYEMSSGPGQDVYLMDFQTGTLWQVDPAGKATVRAPLTGFPAELSLPLSLKDGKIMMFAADSPPVVGEIQEFVRRSDRRITYPALLTIDGKQITSLGREDLRAFAGFPVYTMRIHEMTQAPDGSFVAYDEASGQLMRIAVTKQ